MEEARRAPRRRHSEELGMRVLAECAQPGASVARVALTHGLNANLVHKWRRAGDATGAGAASVLAPAKRGGGEFIALTLSQHSVPVPVAAADIRIELRRGATTVSIHWPTQGGGDCAAWLREWLR